VSTCESCTGARGGSTDTLLAARKAVTLAFAEVVAHTTAMLDREIREGPDTIDARPLAALVQVLADAQERLRVARSEARR
jgi:hypothetical protein